LLAAFVAREATARTPLMPLRMFRSRNVSGANIVQVLSIAGLFGMFFMGSLYMQRVLGYDPLEIGLAFLPATLLMGVLSIRYSEPLIMRFGPRTVLLSGLAIVTASLALFTRAPVDGDYVRDVLPQMILLGLGGGISFPAVMGLAMSGATPEDAGLASGVINTTAQVGAALGLAVLATLSDTRTEHLLADGESAAAALTGGYHLAFLIATGLVLAAIAVGVTVLKPNAKPAKAEPIGQPAAEEG
jgi:fucose permease